MDDWTIEDCTCHWYGTGETMNDVEVEFDPTCPVHSVLPPLTPEDVDGGFPF